MKQIKSSYIIYTFVIIIFIAIITFLFIREYNKRNQKTGYHDANEIADFDPLAKMSGQIHKNDKGQIYKITYPKGGYVEYNSETKKEKSFRKI